MNVFFAWVTGTSNLPPNGYNSYGRHPFTIKFLDSRGTSDALDQPSIHTCFNILELKSGMFDRNSLHTWLNYDEIIRASKSMGAF